jgi:hypothetical protein
MGRDTDSLQIMSMNASGRKGRQLKDFRKSYLDDIVGNNKPDVIFLLMQWNCFITCLVGGGDKISTSGYINLSISGIFKEQSGIFSLNLLVSYSKTVKLVEKSIDDVKPFFQKMGYMDCMTENVHRPGRRLRQLKLHKSKTLSTTQDADYFVQERLIVIDLIYKKQKKTKKNKP